MMVLHQSSSSMVWAGTRAVIVARKVFLMTFIFAISPQMSTLEVKVAKASACLLCD